MHLFTAQIGDKLEVKSFFADGSPCKNCDITVLDANDKEILKGKTDEKGKFTFSLPQNIEKVKIILLAEEGHIVKKTINISALTKEKKVMSKIKNMPQIVEGKDVPQKENFIETCKAMEEEVISLKSEIQALREELLSLRKDIQRFAFRDILGALGYILGIFAIIYFIKKRHAP